MCKRHMQSFPGLDFFPSGRHGHIQLLEPRTEVGIVHESRFQVPNSLQDLRCLPLIPRNSEGQGRPMAGPHRSGDIAHILNQKITKVAYLRNLLITRGTCLWKSSSGSTTTASEFVEVPHERMNIEENLGRLLQDPAPP